MVVDFEIGGTLLGRRVGTSEHQCCKGIDGLVVTSFEPGKVRIFIHKACSWRVDGSVSTRW